VKQRIITALVLAPLAIAAIFFLPLQLFTLFSAALFLLAAKEWAGFVNKTPSNTTIYTFGLILGLTLIAMPVSDIWQNGVLNSSLSLALSSAGVWWCVALLLVIRYPTSAALWSSNKLLKSIFGLLTLLPFFWSLIVLRSVDMSEHFYYGAQLVMYVFLLVWAADTGAYFVGKKFGKTKLAPNVSPGKTIEGFAGGAVSSLVVAFFAAQYFAISDDNLFAFFVISIITTLVSALGDLTESIFKREAGLKDSGKLLPGHGGILDRIDSLTAATPIFALFYIYWLM